jgi:hypothetical protein
MFHRLAPRRSSARLLHFLTLGAIIVMIATAIAFALQTDGAPSQVSDARSCGNESWPYRDGSCRDDAAERSRSIRLVSPDRIQKTTVYTPAARVEIPAASPSQAAEPVLPAPAAIEDSANLPPLLPEEATPLARSITPAVSPRARAETPRRGRSKNAERQPGLELEPGLAPREKSFTGAGGSFDAVH